MLSFHLALVFNTVQANQSGSIDQESLLCSGTHAFVSEGDALNTISALRVMFRASWTILRSWDPAPSFSVSDGFAGIYQLRLPATAVRA